MPAREEVLINAQNLRTSAADAFPGKQLQMPLKPTLNRGARQTLAFGQPIPADAIECFWQTLRRNGSVARSRA